MDPMELLELVVPSLDFEAAYLDCEADFQQAGETFLGRARMAYRQFVEQAQRMTFLQTTLASAPTPQELVCLIETTHGLLITALLDAGIAVYPVNPKTVGRRRKPSGAKTDAIDAYLLANVWVRIIHAMWRKREGYTFATLLHAQGAHATQVA
jgi:Transposase